MTWTAWSKGEAPWDLPRQMVQCVENETPFFDVISLGLPLCEGTALFR
jgi:hypothetical protein